MSDKPPYVLEAADPSAGRPASIIFFHGYGDEAEGLPMGLAQQFQMYKKLPYVRWLLPNAPRDHEAMTRAWYRVKALPNAMKPEVPGHVEEKEQAPDDEEGLLRACNTMDELVQAELDRGVEPARIVVGGFSQGCAVSLVWGQVGKLRNKVGGVLCLSGYFPLAERISELRKERGIAEDDKGSKAWFYIHGSGDMLVPIKLFVEGTEQLLKWVDKDKIEGHVIEGMGHSTNNQLLRAMLGFLDGVLPP